MALSMALGSLVIILLSINFNIVSLLPQRYSNNFSNFSTITKKSQAIISKFPDLHQRDYLCIKRVDIAI